MISEVVNNILIKISRCRPTGQGLANCSPWAKPGSQHAFVNKVLLEQSYAHFFTYCLWLLLHYKKPGFNSCNRPDEDDIPRGDPHSESYSCTILSLECGWNPWFASDQQITAKAMGCYFLDSLTWYGKGDRRSFPWLSCFMWVSIFTDWLWRGKLRLREMSVKRATWRGAAGDLGSWGPQSYNHRELNSANNHVNLAVTSSQVQPLDENEGQPLTWW